MIGENNNEGASISFGEGEKVGISGNSFNGRLSLMASSEFGIIANNGRAAFCYDQADDLFMFSSTVKAPSFLTFSDARLKKNVKSLEKSYLGLNELHPISYNLLKSPITHTVEWSFDQDEQESEAESSENQTHFGFIAQEVREIFPDLVEEDENGMLSIDYIGFIPLLVDAVKNLSEKVAMQDEIIAELTNDPFYKKALDVNEPVAVLKQNTPNPFNTTTNIECTIPTSVSTAMICIYDMQGQQKMHLDISDRGETAVVIDASTLRPGIYMYALIADGNEVDCKRMIITD